MGGMEPVQKKANYHLAIMKKRYLDAILTGQKSVELRLTRGKCAPFGRIAAGDKIFLKQSSGPVCAVASAAGVKEFSDLTAEGIQGLKQQYDGQIGADQEFWESRADCKFAVLVWLKDVSPIEPVRIDKKDWRAWVVLTERQNYGLMGL